MSGCLFVRRPSGYTCHKCQAQKDLSKSLSVVFNFQGGGYPYLAQSFAPRSCERVIRTSVPRTWFDPSLACLPTNPRRLLPMSALHLIQMRLRTASSGRLVYAGMGVLSVVKLASPLTLPQEYQARVLDLSDSSLCPLDKMFCEF
jgi:hypothetical protein